MSRRNVPGTTYLLHLDPPFKHARHYLGFAEGDALAARLADHGGPHGSRLLAAAKQAGSGWRLVRTWPGTTRATERQIKNTRHVPHYCPECQPQRSAARREARRANQSPEREQEMETSESAAKAGHDTAVTTITRQLDAGMTPEQITDHSHDMSAWLLSEAESPDAQSYAAAYDNAAQALAAELMTDARIKAGAAPMAATLPDGTPHADPALSAKGWHAQGGIYTRRLAEAIPDREAI